MADFGSPRVRFPFRAKLVLAGAALFFLAELVVLSIWMMPLLPLVPLFIMVMFGHALILGSVVEWAASLGSTEPVRVERAEAAGKVPATRPAQVAAAA
jgi:hypothetical protein